MPFARCVALVALLGIASLAGCAVRQDASGGSRVGIGLWGFGDPPGVNWNLDWPRREPTELPPARRPELPPLPPRGDANRGTDPANSPTGAEKSAPVPMLRLNRTT
jgi:hypothetical protein